MDIGMFSTEKKSQHLFKTNFFSNIKTDGCSYTR